MVKKDGGTYLVKRADQRRALTSPIRLEIIGQFTTPKSMSIAEVAVQMGRTQGSLYYHFKVLEKVGLLKRVGTRPGRTRVEALYRPVASRIAIAAKAGGAGAKDVLSTMSSAFRMAERDLADALEKGEACTQGSHRNCIAYRMHCRIPKATLAEINKHLKAIERVLERESKGHREPKETDELVSLTIALLPLRGRNAR